MMQIENLRANRFTVPEVQALIRKACNESYNSRFTNPEYIASFS